MTKPTHNNSIQKALDEAKKQFKNFIKKHGSIPRLWGDTIKNCHSEADEK